MRVENVIVGVSFTGDDEIVRQGREGRWEKEFTVGSE